jgi:hypothetical protein
MIGGLLPLRVASQLQIRPLRAQQDFAVLRQPAYGQKIRRTAEGRAASTVDADH